MSRQQLEGMNVGAAPTVERAGAKMSAACMPPLEEKPAKRRRLRKKKTDHSQLFGQYAAADAPPSAAAPPAKNPRAEIESSTLELTISYISGDTLAKVKISSMSSVAELKQKAQERLDSGKVVQKLLKGDTLLQEAQSLAASGLVDGAEVKAIIGSDPMLFVSDPNSADTLFDSDDDFGSDDEDDDDEPPNRGITEAPDVARELAYAMIEVAPRLGDTRIVGSSDDDDGGKIVVIAHPGDDPKKACLKALRVPKYMESVMERISSQPCADESDPEFSGAWRCATLQHCDWSNHLKCGFNTPLEGGEDEAILTLTKIMSEKLERHFIFGFDDDVVRAPMVYGGYASDGNIVGVLTCRVWA